MLSSIPVNLIRQWCYCPRVVYYQILGVAAVRPRWVEQGEDFHRHEEQLWKRRNLSRFKLAEGKKHYQLSMRDEELGLHGIVDMAIETADSVCPVEFKLSTNKKRRGDILQVVAYALLLEKHFAKPSAIGFLVGSGNVLHSIKIDSEIKATVVNVAEQIKTMLRRAVKPDSNATLAQCCNCEYINHCNDRL